MSGRRLDHGQVAHQAVHHRAEHRRGEDRRHRRRRLAVRIRQPGVHGRQTHLGAVADEQEDEPELGQLGIESRGNLAQGRPQHNIRAAVGHAAGRRAEDEHAQKGDGDADRADHQVLPRRFQGLARTMERDEEGGHQGGGFHANPHQTQVVGDEHEGHRRQRPQPQRTEDARLARRELGRGEVAGREQGAGREDEGQQTEVKGRKRVEPQPTMGSGQWPGGKDAKTQHRAQERVCQHQHRQAGKHGARRAGQQAQPAADQRAEKNQPEQMLQPHPRHPLSRFSFSTSM